MPKPKEKSEPEEEKDKAPARWEDSARDFFSRVFDEDWLEPFGWRQRRGRLFPRVDVSETEDEVKVVADMPGIDLEDVEIDIRENRMRISGRTERERGSDERPFRFERSHGEFRREFLLPARVQEGAAKAIYKDGVLTITIPKAEDERRSKIKIERE